MTIWILAVLLFGIVGALGRQVGALRMSISLVGVTVALFVAGPLAPVFRKALEVATIKNPVTVWSLAAPLAFLAVVLVFNSIAVAVYLKIGNYYKYRAKDDIRIRWERMDGQLGLCVGIVAAVVYLIAGSAYVYHVGYVTKQVESPGDNPFWLGLANKMRDDLSSTKFDRVAAAVTTASPAFTQTADLVGLLYHNKELQARLPEYPLFMSLAENGKMQNAFTNAPFAGLLPAKTNVSLILKDPTTETLINHPEIQRVVKEVDLTDLLGYLKTGKSEKYAKEPMVGKWQLDVAATVKQYTRADPKVTVNNQNRLRGMLRLRMGDYLLITTPDEKVYLKGTQKPLSGFGTLLTQLFQVPPAPPASTNQPPTLYAGSWKKDGETYQVSIQTEQGEKTAEATFMEGGKLATSVGPNTVVFSRID
ncbi:MAG: hypothetical protein ACKODH_11960 [Limisphaerales bacterium]